MSSYRMSRYTDGQTKNMKTPDYTRRAQKNARERKKAKGYKWFSVLTTPEIVTKLRAAYQRLKSEV